MQARNMGQCHLLHIGADGGLGVFGKCNITQIDNKTSHDNLH